MNRTIPLLSTFLSSVLLLMLLMWMMHCCRCSLSLTHTHTHSLVLSPSFHPSIPALFVRLSVSLLVCWPINRITENLSIPSFSPQLHSCSRTLGWASRLLLLFLVLGACVANWRPEWLAIGCIDSCLRPTGSIAALLVVLYCSMFAVARLLFLCPFVLPFYFYFFFSLFSFFSLLSFSFFLASTHPFYLSSFPPSSHPKRPLSCLSSVLSFSSSIDPIPPVDPTSLLLPSFPSSVFAQKNSSSSHSFLPFHSLFVSPSFLRSFTISQSHHSFIHSHSLNLNIESTGTLLRKRVFVTHRPQKIIHRPDSISRPHVYSPLPFLRFCPIPPTLLLLLMP